MKLSVRLASILVVLPTVAGAVLAQSVWVVDASGGGDFTDLPEAVAAAAGGDVLLMKSGDYSRLELHEKGLALIAEPGATVRVDGVFSTLVPAWSSLLVRGVEFVNRTPVLGTCAVIGYQLGPVWLEDCVFRFAADAPPAAGTAALEIDMCESVTLVDCAVLGRDDSVWYGGYGVSPAMKVIVSNVVAYRTSFVGARGYPATLAGATQVVQPCRGGAGISADIRNVLLYDCTVVGGAGGDGGFLLDACVDGASGGPGVLLPAEWWGTSWVYLLATPLEGGAPGAIGGPSCATGDVGHPYEVHDGFVVDVPHPGAPRELAAPAVVREGESLSLAFQGGAPGDLVLVGVSLAPPAVAYLHPWLGGAIVLDLPILVVDAGVMPSSGPLAASFPVAPMPPSMQAQPLFLQSLHLGVEPGLGTGAAVVVLDAAF